MSDLSRTVIEITMNGVPAGEIGRYLACLTPAQEDRVLTQRMAHAPHYIREDGCRCLRGTAEDWQLRRFTVSSGYTDLPQPTDPVRNCPSNWSGRVYDLLCLRFGAERINQAVRNRVLRNRARRTLTAPIMETVAV